MAVYSSRLCIHLPKDIYGTKQSGLASVVSVFSAVCIRCNKSKGNGSDRVVCESLAVLVLFPILNGEVAKDDDARQVEFHRMIYLLVSMTDWIVHDNESSIRKGPSTVPLQCRVVACS